MAVVLNTQTHAVEYRLSLEGGAAVDLAIPPHALHTVRVPAMGRRVVRVALTILYVPRAPPPARNVQVNMTRNSEHTMNCG